ncbi:MAG: DUF4157 domain-containing protein [Cyclobacteriaceae bacterium]
MAGPTSTLKESKKKATNRLNQPEEVTVEVNRPSAPKIQPARPAFEGIQSNEPVLPKMIAPKPEPDLQMKCEECEEEEQIQMQAKPPHMSMAGNADDEEEDATLQPKLKIGAPDDEYEKEADAVADQVMRMPDPKVNSDEEIHPKAASIQAKIKTSNEKEGAIQRNTGIPTANHASHDVTRKLQNAHGGRSLSPHLQHELGIKMRADFSGVKIHNDPSGAQMSRHLGARAFTYGNHIYFNQGEYVPGTSKGKHLLAHELTHTIQQSNGIKRTPDIQKEEVQRQPDRKNWAYSQQLTFQFEVDKSLPAAKKQEKGSQSMQWCMERIFGADPGMIVLYQQSDNGWVWYKDTESYLPGETLKILVDIGSYTDALSVLRPDRMDEVEKFKEIQKIQEQLTHTDYEFFERWMLKTGKAKINFEGTGAPFDLQNLDKYKEELEYFIANKEKILKSSGLLHSYFLTEDKVRKLNFEVLKDKLFGKQAVEITEADKAEVLRIFKEIALAKVFVMLEEAYTIAVKESARYKKNPAELDELVTLLSGTFAPKYNMADELRAEAARRFIADHQLNEFSVPGGKMTGNFRRMIKANKGSKKDLMEAIATMDAENVQWQFENVYAHNTYLKLGAPKQYSLPFKDAFKASKEYVETNYPEFVLARLEDYKTTSELKEKHTGDHPILHDISTDFRILSRKPSIEIKTKVMEILEEKKTSSLQTKRKLLRDPDLVWEFEPLLRGMMQEEGLSKDDVMGKIIHDKIESIKSSKFWRSLALGALGIVLGIAGFFTGGATWAGAALIAASITVSAIDLAIELEDYYFQADASKAVFTDTLTTEPSMLGVVFAIAGLVIDFADVLKLIKPLGKALKNTDEVAEYAGEIYDQIKSAGKLKGDIAKEDFVKQLVEGWEKRQQMMQKIPADIKQIIEGENFQSLAPGVKEGLLKVMDENPMAFSTIMKTVGPEVEVLSRLAIISFVDPKVVGALSDITKLLPNEAAIKKVFLYYGTVGAKGAFGLPDVVDIINRGAVKNNPNLVEEILTNRSLQQVMLNHATHPDGMANAFKLYKDHLASLPSGGTKPSFLDFLKEKGENIKLDETLGGATKLKELNSSQITFTANLDPKDLEIARSMILKMVDEKKVLSGHQLQAIIRQAEAAADVVGNMRGFLWQLNIIFTRASKYGMEGKHLALLLKGLESGDDFASSYEIFKAILKYSGDGQGVKMAGDLLNAVSLKELSKIKGGLGEAFPIQDLSMVAAKADVIPGDGKIIELIDLAKTGSSDGNGLTRLRHIMDFMEGTSHTVDEIKAAINAADEFDTKLLAALSDSKGGLESTAKLLWGESAELAEGEIKVSKRFRRPLAKGDVEGSGNQAYKQVMQKEKVEKTVGQVVDGTEVDHVKWSVIRKTINDATIDQTIKNKIIGDLWEKVNERALKNQGYFVHTQVEILYTPVGGGKPILIRADAIAVKGDEVKLIDFKSGQAQLNLNQDLVYKKIAKGEELDSMKIKDEALDAKVKDPSSKRVFEEIRESYTGN